MKENSLTAVILLALREVWGHLSAVTAPAPKNKLTNKSDLKEEARMLSEWAAAMIKSGEARQFLIKNGFITRAGKLTKRYGG